MEDIWGASATGTKRSYISMLIYGDYEKNSGLMLQDNEKGCRVEKEL